MAGARIARAAAFALTTCLALGVLPPIVIVRGNSALQSSYPGYNYLPDLLASLGSKQPASSSAHEVQPMTQPGGPPAAVIDALRRELTEQELETSVVYVTADQLPASTHLELPRLSLDVPWDAYLAFVDRQPLANWSHSARYVLFNLTTGESRSYEAKFPPFGPESRERWLLAHKAASVPDSAVHTPG